MSAHRLTYRDALRLAPVATARGIRVTIEGRCGCGCGGFLVEEIKRGVYPTVAWPTDITRPNAAARKLMEALR